ncbi:MAG: phosphatidate cytidylyltransferase [Paracoccaceae bacterium]
MSERPSDGRYKDLWVRTLSGAALALVALGAFWYGPPVSTLLIAIGVALMVMECQNMVLAPMNPDRFALAVAVGLGAGLIFLQDIMGFRFFLPALAVSVAMIITLEARRRAWVAASFAYVVAAMASLVALRATSAHGFELVLWLILVVAAADIGAYFSGRRFGGPKLWPAVSPKKTWSGTAGGWVSALGAGAIFAAAAGISMPKALALSLVAAVASQAGDLMESALKRHFGVKDAGNFLPGHGGVLDRLDGLMAAAILCAAIGLRYEYFLA